MDPLAGVSSLEAADLDELADLAEIHARIDRKYIVEADVASLVIERLGDRVAALEIEGARVFPYTSLYFDTPDLLLYRETATGRRRRFKVRSRTYGDSAGAMLEVKTRGGRGSTIKTRAAQHSPERDALSSRDRTFVDEISSRPGIADQLRPTLTTSYVRSTLLDRAGGTRTTIDRDVAGTEWEGSSVRLSSVVVETKSPGGASETDRVLWRLGHRPVRLSKFCTSLAALHPELPSNKWHRTLRRHF